MTDQHNKNRERRAKMPKIVIDKDLCKACKLCMIHCPKHIITLGEELNSKGERYAIQIDEEACLGCRICGIMCPDAAISVYVED